MGREIGGKFRKKYLWMILVDISWETTKFYKAITFNLKINKVAKKQYKLIYLQNRNRITTKTSLWLPKEKWGRGVN